MLNFVAAWGRNTFWGIQETDQKTKHNNKKTPEKNIYGMKCLCGALQSFIIFQRI